MAKIYFYLFILLLKLVSYTNSYSQDPKSTNNNSEFFSGEPIISNNDSKFFFVRNLKFGSGYYGGILSKEKHWFDLDNIKNNNNDHYKKNLSNNIIGINSSKDIIYFVNGKKPNSKYSKPSKFKGLFFSEKISNLWSMPKELKFNGVKANNIHSFFMNKACDLIIISMWNKKEGNESYDLYLSTKKNTDEWSDLMNLGPTINTKNDEVTPFLDEKNNTLYFSSNGHKGYGEFDVLYSKNLHNSWKVWQLPKNIGNSINTKNDELYFSIVSDSIGFIVKKNEYNLTSILKLSLPNTHNNNLKTKNNFLFLKENEIEQILNLPQSKCVISFAPESILLNSDEKELLWFIVNKIKSKPELKIGLLYKSNENNTNNLVSRRVFVISQYLEYLGIDSESVLTEKMENDNIEGYSVDDILVKLYISEF
ncbi:PD40 domain-containing protein [Flexithrix dorotheae]|uniref:PD40 domain-containing protein n=1 Tax=Flexithrix dorotheae TaxID=70993 RepID=UPI000364FCDB|nr:PD40 domain-containing protein [Flexithrix dorotheae]